MSKPGPYRCLATGAVAAAVVAIGFAARAEPYVIDPKHTEVRFSYTMGLAVQRGRFTSVRGTMDFDPNIPEKTRVTAVIATDSLTTGEAAIESALKGRQFFDVSRQPEISFQSNAVQLTGPGSARMTGVITVNGITQPITFDVSIKSGDDPRMKYRVGSRRFIAIGQIQRSDFNMTAYRSMVADEVAIEIDALLKRKDRRAAQE